MSKTPREQFPNYLRTIVKYSGNIRPGEAYITNVRHDDWCDFWSGGVCNCNPDIERVLIPDMRGRGN